MRIAVIGAGMAGVAAAHALAREGHEVTVLERRASVAEGASFAPAGIAAPGLAAPWLPMPGGLRAFSPLRARGRAAARLRETGAAFATGRRAGAEAERRAARALGLLRALRAGLGRIDALTRELELEFERGDGLLLTLADGAASAQAETAVAWLQEAGERVEWADAARRRALEPDSAVAADAPRAAYLPDARVGNPREWTQLLRAHAQSAGVRFLFQREVVALAAGPRPTLRYAADDGGIGEAAFDAVVVCAALESSRLLASLGVKLPWRPLRGWTVTAPLQQREASGAGPRAALLDVRSGVSICRLGARVRVAGGHARCAPAAEAPPPTRRQLQPLYDAVDAGFPGAVHWPQAQVWQAARAVLPDGLPAVGASGVPGIWLDVGHAHHGWALGQFAAGALCAMIGRREPEPEIGADPRLFAPQRWT
jgi:D-amino-acid dehydrogenase